ncbi:hypothetical protein BJ973_004346 [Actinoplanes tereljensis]|uniref:LamG-like jellyroll fold domain-containing protein n=1 Tax=Paractinoplanes tereljensis TaxID=571912 RepID=A0A919TWZ0_9ACTN|nr:carboxypeptidase regulatory-like domain-containing protein [Actinoplanes tereljensis]GIF23735.1 hypothetical protein Ate02nite_64650 [Actinoplanes tereljensis]
MLSKIGLVLAVVSAGVAFVPPAKPAVAAPVTKVPCAAERPNLAAAVAAQKTCEGPIELLDQRDEMTQTFLNDDGSQTLEVSMEPERVRKGKGWTPVDTNLVAGKDGVAPRAAVLPVRLSAGGTGPLLELKQGAHQLRLTWPGTLPKPLLDGDTAVYRDVLPGVDLRVTAEALGFSEVLVVKTPAAAKNPKLATLKFGVDTDKLKMTKQAGGGVVAADTGDGSPVFTAPAPLMWDSSESLETTVAEKKPAPEVKNGDEPERGARQALLGVKVAKDALTLSPDKKLLADPTAKFPLYIDPSFTGAISGNAWAIVMSKHPGSSFWQNSTALTDGKVFGSAGAGRTEDCSSCADHIVRSFFRMDVAKAKGKIVTAATFRIEQRHSWTCSPKSNAKVWLTGAITSKTTWNNQPAWNSGKTATTAANRKNGAIHGCSGPGTDEFNVTSIIKYVVETQKSTTATLGLRAIDEGTKNQWKRFNHASPKLSVTYNSKPNAPTDRKSDGKVCATGASRPYVLSATPFLAAKHSDPDTDQQSLTTSFYWWPLGGAKSESNKISFASGNPASASKQIPAGKLTDGVTYAWNAVTSDGKIAGPSSGNCEFTVDATPPAPPSKVLSTDYPAGSTPSGGVGINGKFVISAPTTRPHEVKSYAYSLDSGVLTNSRTQTAKADYSAEITLPPLHDGSNVLYVWSRDAAGRYSTAVPYTFTVKTGDGPAAEWNFDEESGNALDASTHGNAATLSGTTARVAGRSNAGKSLNLTGAGAATRTGALTVPHPTTGVATPIRTDASFTVSARVKLSTLGGTGKPTIVAANGTRTSAYQLGYSREDNKWRFALAGSDVDSPALYSVLSNGAPTANKWTYVTGVYNATTKAITLYVDGVLQTATATATTTFDATSTVTIGKRLSVGVDADFWTGGIDDVRVTAFGEAVAKIADQAKPLPATLTLGATEVAAGGKLPVTFSSGTDLNVTKFKYSVDSQAFDKEVAVAAGANAAFDVTVGSVAGDHILYVIAVDSGSRISVVTQESFEISSPAGVAGTAIDIQDTFEAVAGVTVTLNPGGLTQTTGTDGGFSFTGLAAGIYTVKGTKGGPCGISDTFDIEIGTDLIRRDLYLMKRADDIGHTCTAATAALTTGTTALSLTGDDAVAAIDLPFAFPYYGQTYRKTWVDTNGVLTFDDPAGSHPDNGGALPAPLDPNALVAPFWDDLVVDASASVKTKAVAGAFTVQWNNVALKADTTKRVSFEAVLAETGDVTFNYDGLDTDAEKGSGAAIGIEAPDGGDGLPYSVDSPQLATGMSIKFALPVETDPVQKFDLSGTLKNAAGAVAANVTVTLDPTGLTTKTAADGTWSFVDVVADAYTVSAALSGRCAPAASAQVELFADTVQDLQLGPDYGSLGYACSIGTGGFEAADTVLALTGDDVALAVTTPFPVLLHGLSFSSVYVSTNGFLTFGTNSTGTARSVNQAMPTAGAPDSVVAPFWDDLEVDASASVLTKVTGTAPNRTWIVEWRNVKFRPSGPDRITFEAKFAESGPISFHYGTLTTALQQGAAATVGIESASGTVASQYSYLTAAVVSNSSITYNPAPLGTISGTVSVAVTGTPAAGLTVTLNPGNKTAVTTADGSYQFTGLPVGEYTVAALTGDSRCAGQSSKEAVPFAGGVADIDLSVMTEGDEFGYKCTTGTTTFVPGDITEGWTGDEVTWQKNPPFPIKLYGESYTSAWINSNGLISFKDPMYFGWIGSASSPLPSLAAEGIPNAAVYVQWSDWVLDANSKIATKTSGTAPNRQWVVEWRNVVQFGYPNSRSSFEVIFNESGEITLAYADITSTEPRERGSTATIGIENASGTIAFQYSAKEQVLASGMGITFKPNPPGQGVVTGTVSCAGIPVAGASVKTAGLSATTAADGTYRIEAVPAGNYAVIATQAGGDCAGSAVNQVTVGTNTTGVIDFAATATPANSGYKITEQAVAYTPADTTVLPVTGDEAITQITLPFAVKHYGNTYTSAWIDSNGLLTYENPGTPSSDAWPIPSLKFPEEPNNAVYPFWHDWVVDSSASVRTATRGTAPNRQFVVEWRNVSSYEDPNTRVTFQAILDEAGGYSFAYTDIDGTFLEKGGAATIGIENAEGTVALQYTYRQPVLRPGIGLRIDAPTS